MIISDQVFIRRAIEIARQARQAGERPFGAVLVLDGKVVAEAPDRCRAFHDPTAHAELQLLSSYCRTSGKFDLTGATLYSCAEPCVMCSGAIKWAGISRVVFSVPQERLQTISGGRIKPTCDELVNTGNRHVEVLGSVLIEEGLDCLKGFDFSSHRQEIIRDGH